MLRIFLIIFLFTAITACGDEKISEKNCPEGTVRQSAEVMGVVMVTCSKIIKPDKERDDK